MKALFFQFLFLKRMIKLSGVTIYSSGWLRRRTKDPDFNSFLMLFCCWKMLVPRFLKIRYSVPTFSGSPMDFSGCLMDAF